MPEIAYNMDTKQRGERYPSQIYVGKIHMAWVKCGKHIQFFFSVLLATNSV